MAETAISSAHLPQSLLLGIEVAGVLALLAALMLPRSGWVVPAVVAVAIPEGAVLALGGPAQWTPVLGALLLAAAELAFWSIEREPPAKESAEVGVSRGLWLVGLCLIGCAAGLLMTLIAAIPVSGGFDLTLLGVVGAIGILVVLLWLGRDVLRPHPSGRR
ncbi:MAG: hypothetical protein ACRENX_00585 [Candidatus Dormibacteria bacterium]